MLTLGPWFTVAGYTLLEEIIRVPFHGIGHGVAAPAAVCASSCGLQQDDEDFTAAGDDALLTLVLR